MCQVISSPELVEFGIMCMGAKPRIDLQVVDCPADVIASQQPGSKKKGTPARDRSKSPAKGTRATSKRPAGDENASATDPGTKQGPDAKKGMTRVRRPSSTSLKARPGANQQEAESSPPRPASSASPAALPRGRGTPSRTGARPSSTRPRGLPSSKAPGASAKQPSSTDDAAAGKAGNEASELASGPASSASKAQAKGDSAAVAGKAADAGQPAAAKAAETAKPMGAAASGAAGAKGKKGGPAVPEPAAISLEADQSPLEGTAQVCHSMSPVLHSINAYDLPVKGL